MNITQARYTVGAMEQAVKTAHRSGKGYTESNEINGVKASLSPSWTKEGFPTTRCDFFANGAKVARSEAVTILIDA